MLKNYEKITFRKKLEIKKGFSFKQISTNPPKSTRKKKENQTSKKGK